MKKVYKPSELHSLLKAYGTSAKKRFSQNFLIDYNILKKIITTADVQKDDVVLEIGAGPGALTEMLLDRGARVIAIELDPKLVQILNHLKEGNNHLNILEADVLKLPLENICKEACFLNLPDTSSDPTQIAKNVVLKKIKIVANLPYHITTPILTRLLPLYQWVESLTIMVQKEFAERMAALVATAAYSSFTLFLQYYSHVKLCFTISPSCFYPPPKIHSAIVQCILHQPPLEEKYAGAFFKMTRSAFQQRRKMLRTSLKLLYPLHRIDEAMQQMHVNPKARPEELSLSQFLMFFRFLLT